MKPHKHKALIIAWANGATIQYKYEDDWHDCVVNPSWQENYEYRIKPEPKPDVKRTFKLEGHPLGGLRFTDSTHMLMNEDEQWICCTFDGETGKLKAVELI